MKHHIAVKFIAVVLCAAALLGIVGCGVGIFVMSELGLYDKTVEQLYQEQIDHKGGLFAQGLVRRYTSLELGSMPEEILSRYDYPLYTPFTHGLYSYELRDVDGNVVESDKGFPGITDPTAQAAVYSFPVSGKYMHLVSRTTASEENAAETVAETTAPVIPCQGLTMDPAPVRLTHQGDEFQLEVAVSPEDTTDQIRYYSLNESIAAVDETGKVTSVNEGETKIVITCGNFKLERNIVCRSQEDATAPTEATVPTTEPFQYDAWDDETWERIQTWIQEEWSKDTWENDKWDDMARWAAKNWAEDEWTDDQWAQLQYWIETEWNTEEPTEPETVPETVPETQAPTVPVEAEPAGTLPAEPAGEPTPSADTTPVLINGRPLTDYEVYTDSYYDHELDEEVHVQYVLLDAPEYTVELRLAPGAVTEDTMLPILHFLQNNQRYMVPLLLVSLLVFAILAVYLCCAAGRSPKSEEVRAGGLNRLPLELYGLLTIGGIGCLMVAIVEGGDYLLRQNLFTGCTLIALFAYAACLIAVGFCFAVAAQVKTPGRFWLRNSVFGHCLRLLRWLWRRFAGHFPTFGRWLSAGWHWCRDMVCFVCVRFARLFTMLPLVWQWIIIGLAMLLLPVIAIVMSSALLLFLAILVDALVVLYGAYAFGRLLDGTKRMSQGDLDSRIEDRHLVGGFQVFARNLNALAAVAALAAQKQLKSERMKTELITNVSHDIKTPLTSIVNYVDLLQKPHTQEEQEQYLEVLARQSRQLKKLIEDLIEMSKASTGNMSVDITQMDAVEVVNQTLGEFSDKLDRAQLTPVFRHSEDVAPIMADGKLTWRVLSNLLSNAVKYALPGTRLYIDLMQVEGKVILSMKNVSREELNIDAEELMERFVRGDGSRNTEGSGLGLNIAKSMMELQKGQLELLVDGDLFKVTLIFPGA